MIFLDHIGLSGDFEPCENNLPYINRNFRIIDSILQMSAVSFIDSPPTSPEEGQVYIIENPSYTYGTTDSIIAIYNGHSWIFVEPKVGFRAYVESEGSFFWFNGSEWALDPMSDGDVKGPASSLSNSIARFDGVTGKFITDSGVILNNDNVISGAASIYSGNIITSKILTGILGGDDSLIEEGPAKTITLSSVFGTIEDPIVEIDTIEIPDTSKSYLFSIENKSGSPTIIKNNASILTGTGKDFVFKDGTSILVSYSSSSNTFNVVSGGGGSGSGVLIVESKTERDDIPEDDRFIGLEVFIDDDDKQIQTTYQLIGGITNNKWTLLGGGNNSTRMINAFGGPIYEADHNVLISSDSDNTVAAIQAGMPIGKEFNFIRTADDDLFEFKSTVTIPAGETFLDGTTSYTLPEVGDTLKIKKITTTLWGIF